MFEYPSQAALNRVVSKNKIYEHAKPSKSVKDQFVAQIDQITWAYKLAPETINLPAKAGVAEVQVFDVLLKQQDYNQALLQCMDKAIYSPIFFNLRFEDQVRTVATYKRLSDSDSSKWVVSDSYFESPWRALADPCMPLPVALDMAGLYASMLRVLIPLPARAGESIKEQVERMMQINQKQKECQKLELKLQSENQFNRKVEVNAQLRETKNQLNDLLS